MKKTFAAAMSILMFGFISTFHFQAAAQAIDNENAYVKNKTGTWSVAMTLTPAPSAPAQIIKDIVAERSMVGPYCLHEVMHPVKGAKMPDFTRLADLAYNKNEQRWDYMSIDTRITGGIMYFTYSGHTTTTISSFITSVPNPGFGPSMTGRGQAMHIRNEIIRVDNDHDLVRQYWRAPDQKEWLMVQYEYARIH